MFSHSVVSNFCNPTDCDPPASSVHGILQARIVEWVSISPSREYPQLIKPKSPAAPSLAGVFFTIKPLGKPNCVVDWSGVPSTVLEDFASDYFANKVQLDINLRTFICFHLFLQNGFPGGSVVKKKKKIPCSAGNTGSVPG